MNFTNEQTKVLENNSNNLLVSASAGSGKTATIIEKIFKLVSRNIDILSLLVITFTESTSTEMKMRLKERLREGAKTDKRLREQLEKINLSDISTLHSFCSKMIRKYYFYLDLKPNFLVLSDTNSSFLKTLALDKVIKKYAKAGDEEFVRLSSIFDGGRGFDSLKKNILSLYEFLCGVEDKEKFRQETMLSCYNEDFDKNKAILFLNKYLVSNIKYLKRELNNYLNIANKDGAEFFVSFIGGILLSLEGFKEDRDFMYNHEVLSKFNLPIMTRKKLQEKDAEFKEEFKGFWEVLRDRVSDLKSFCLDEEEYTKLKENLKISRDFLVKFAEVESSFEEEYKNIKERRNALDFSDLERYFLKLISNADVRDSLKYSYIFVDEYQDINSVQESILLKLSKNAKMLMVGDVKQSIYGFRNSTPEIFVEKARKFRKVKNEGDVIDLNENFRSNEIVLEFVNEIFKRCMSEEFGGVDYSSKGMLKSGAKYEKCSDVPVVEIDIASIEKEERDESFDKVYSILRDKNNYKKRLTNARREAMIVARKILDMIGKDYYDVKSKTTKKIDFSDIAILSRKNEYLAEIALVLTEYKVPISSNMLNNIYKNIDVALLISLLRLLDNFHNDVELSTVLRSPFFNFTFDDLAKIRKEYSDEKYFYNAFKRYGNEKQDDLAIKIRLFNKTFSDMKKSLVYLSLYDFLLDICNKYDYFTYLLSLPDGQNRVKNVEDFVSTFKNSDYNYSLFDFIDYLDSYGEDSRFKSTRTSGERSVTLTTIHQSKGLEYPVVFLVGTGEGFSNKTFIDMVLKDKDMGLGLYTYDLENFCRSSNLARNAITLHKKRSEKAEELRLLYVALTRAKNHLFVVGCSTLKKTNFDFLSLLNAQGVNNYLGWILSILSPVNYKNLFINHKDVVQKYGKNFVNVSLYSESNFEEDNTRDLEISFSNEKKNDSKKLKEILNKKIVKSKRIALKNSVSSLLFEREDNISNKTETPKTLSIYESKNEDVDYMKLGTLYHSIMEKIDFSKPLSKENYDKILGEIEVDLELKKEVSFDKISRAVDCILNLGQNLKTQKELPFISFIPYKEIFSDSGRENEKVIVQGIADLVVESEDKKCYLIDYKTTKAGATDRLVEKYFIQLKLYRICLEKALNKRFDGVFIYSFYFDKLIKVF